MDCAAKRSKVTQITIPDVLSRVAKLESRSFHVEGSTIADGLRALCLQHSSLTPHFFYDDGQVKEHFMLVIDGELVSPDTPLSATTTLEVLLAASGGTGARQPAALSELDRARYARHLLLPQVGEEGQAKIKSAKVLIVGTGGLGSPISMYLAAAGVGTIGLVDFDVVDHSNLQRQIVHGVSSVGVAKVLSAKKRLQDTNDQVEVLTHDTPLTDANADALIADYDILVDGCDNYPTRYLMNRAARRRGIPYVYGSIFQFDGQVSVFFPDRGPCYQCLHPTPPPASIAPNANNKGVFGVLPGVVGLLEATEALKIILGLGEPLSGRLLTYDALSMRFRELKFARRPNCPTCGPRHAGDDE